MTVDGLPEYHSHWNEEGHVDYEHAGYVPDNLFSEHYKPPHLEY